MEESVAKTGTNWDPITALVGSLSAAVVSCHTALVNIKAADGACAGLGDMAERGWLDGFSNMLF